MQNQEGFRLPVLYLSVIQKDFSKSIDGYGWDVAPNVTILSHSGQNAREFCVTGNAGNVYVVENMVPEVGILSVIGN